MDRVDPEAALRMATEIVVAYLGQATVEPDRLATLVREVRSALTDRDARASSGETAAPAPAEPRPHPQPQPQPAISPHESVTPDFIISLEDGRPYRSLKRHLMARHGMTPDDYRRKWGLPADYPMVAPSYAAERSAVAKRIGLGRGVATAPVKPAARSRKAPARRVKPKGA